jgi:hypothetical protein
MSFSMLDHGEVFYRIMRKGKLAAVVSHASVALVFAGFALTAIWVAALILFSLQMIS